MLLFPTATDGDIIKTHSTKEPEIGIAQIELAVIDNKLLEWYLPPATPYNN